MSPVRDPCPLDPVPPAGAPGDEDGLAPGDGESGMPVTPLAGETPGSGLPVEVGVIAGDGKSVVPVEGVGPGVVGVTVGVAVGVLVGVEDGVGTDTVRVRFTVATLPDRSGTRTTIVWVPLARPLIESVSQRLVM
jgi:hypothetical protein